MRSFEQYDEAHKYFTEGVQRDSNADDVQAQLQLYDVSLGEYLTNKYALWLDFKTIDENDLHGMGRRIENTSEGITLQIEKKAESESEYRNHFDFIIIICPTLRYNSTYKSRGWVWNDPDVIPIEPGNQLCYLIEKISNLLAGLKTLFLIDDIIADEALDKRCQLLLELVISGRHRQHSLWLLTQLYTAVPNNVRRQAKMLYVWYPKNRTDLNIIHEENDIIEMGELARVKAQLKRGKHTCLIMRMEHQRAYTIH